jgi:hypothetical protein
MPKSLPSAKEASWRQIVDEYASSGRSAKEFCQLKAISLRMFNCWRRKITLKDKWVDPLNGQWQDNYRDLAIVPFKVIAKPEELMATHALDSQRAAPSVRISLANKIAIRTVIVVPQQRRTKVGAFQIDKDVTG